MSSTQHTHENREMSSWEDGFKHANIPMETLARLVTATMLKDYGSALEYCKMVLELEPELEVAHKLRYLLTKRMENKTENESESDSGYESDSTRCESDSSICELDSATESDVEAERRE
ncbi:uncharacterized protein LOC124354789 [Homalodisca vitripennis]|uniref:uncharacterized protein LOC124354789 n=1 Tax=Homalodisca vitripennis TaxID=197043 RepID=UPI001EEC53A8|nr:uncharacterized protein LOC124354789 [Homalodisca vitripennis]KAG8317884.1 hypothetical protein J6590_015871 [Homalodisca vitripennis]